MKLEEDKKKNTINFGINGHPNIAHSYITYVLMCAFMVCVNNNTTILNFSEAVKWAKMHTDNKKVEANTKTTNERWQQP